MRALIGEELTRKLPRKNVDIRDTKLGGFVVRCRASGRHSYLVNLGRGRWVTIGRTDADGMTAAKARVAAEKIAGDVGHDALVKVSADASLTLAEAKEQARAAVTARRRQRRRTSTVGVYIRDTYGPWAREHQKTGDETEARLASAFATFDGLALSDLSAFAIEKWRTARLKAGVTPATVNRDLAALRGALTKAVEWRLLAVHPMETVKASKIDVTGHVRYLSDAEAKRLRAALSARDERRRAERDRANEWRRSRGYSEWPAFGTYTDHLTPIVLLALNTGCRRGELLGLRWSDVDLVAARLTVRAEGAKSGLSRVIPLNTEAAAALKAWRPDAPGPSAVVFPGADGAPMSDLKTAWLAIVKAAKITRFRFHDLRHDFASKLVQAGVDLERLRVLLGHADTKMVTRYAHLRAEDLAAAVATLGRS